MRTKILVVLSGLFFLVGCATAPVKLQPVAGAKVDLSKYDTLVVNVSKAEGVEMSEKDLEEMGTLIVQAIQKHCRFKQVFNGNSINRSSLSASLILEVRFTDFARPNLKTAVWATLGLDPSGKLRRVSGEISLVDSRGNSIMNGVLTKHGGSTLLGGEQPSPFRGSDWKVFFAPYKWIRERFAEGVAKGIADALSSS